MSDIDSPYLTGNFGPVDTEETFTDLEVVGRLPHELDGRWLRNGPNPAGPVDPATHHWFLGEGMIHGIRLRDGRAEWYRNRWIRSRSVAQALGEEPPAGAVMEEVDFGPNTSVTGFGGRTLALVEGGPSPVELSYELDTVGVERFGGTLPLGFTAHPKLDPASGELHAVCYSYPALMDQLLYLVVGPEGRVIRKVEVPVADMPMVHDMSLTEHWAIVYDLPITVDFSLVETNPFPMRWNPDHAARVGLIPRAPTAVAADIIWCEVEPCFVFHPLNAFEELDGTIVVDLCRYERLFASDVRGPFDDPSATLDRWRIDPVRARVAEERIFDEPVEFPRHDPRVGTRRHRWAYLAQPGEGPWAYADTVKVDCHSGAVTRHDWGVGRGGEEPVFVPRQDGEDEDDGWLLVAVYDAATTKSSLAVLDARDIAADPVAEVKLPVRIPHGFHGDWIPG